MPTLERTAAELPVTTKIDDYLVVDGDVGTEIQFSKATAVTVSLPGAWDVENGFNLVVRNIGAGTLTVDPSASDLIDGVASLSLSMGDWHWIRNDGTGWKTIASNSTEVSDDSITTAKLADNAVTAAKLADNAVTTAKIADNAVNGTKIAMGSDAQGDILYYDGTNYVRLPAGTSGQFLQTQGPGANPQWADASGGDMVKLAETDITTATSTVDFTQISSTYKNYLFIGSNLTRSVAANVQIDVRLSNDGGSTFHSSGYMWVIDDASIFSGGGPNQNASGNYSDSSMEIINGSVNTGTFASQFTLWLHNPLDTSHFTYIQGSSASIQDVTNDPFHSSNFAGKYNTAEANDAVRFLLSSGSFGDGTITMYGLK